MAGKPKYELFEHTADIGLYIYGRGLAELFANAAEALTWVLTDPAKIESAEERRVCLSEDSTEALLRRWMAELHYLYSAEGWLTARVEFLSLDGNSLEAVLRGEKLDPARHEVKDEVKGVTWHRLRIEPEGGEGGLRASVVLDV
jgi:SHS2 domain-containing protein